MRHGREIREVGANAVFARLAVGMFLDLSQSRRNAPNHFSDNGCFREVADESNTMRRL
jgi:hypothetical protein